MDFVVTWALATPFPDHRQQSCLPEMAVLTHEPTSPGKHSRSCAPQRWYHCRDGHTAAASIRSGRAASCQQTTAQHPEPPPAIPSLSTSSQAGTRLSSGLQGSHRNCAYFKHSAQLCLGCHRSAGILHAVAQRHTDIPPAAGVPHHLPHATPTCVPIQTHLRARTDGSVTKNKPDPSVHASCLLKSDHIWFPLLMKEECYPKEKSDYFKAKELFFSMHTQKYSMSLMKIPFTTKPNK